MHDLVLNIVFKPSKKIIGYVHLFNFNFAKNEH